MAVTQPLLVTLHEPTVTISLFALVVLPPTVCDLDQDRADAKHERTQTDGVPENVVRPDTKTLMNGPRIHGVQALTRPWEGR